MENIEKIRTTFLRLSKNEITSEIDKALNYAKTHKSDNTTLAEQLRMALEVGRICLKEINLHNSLLIVCILYFTIDKDSINLDEIEELFGKKIANILLGLIKSPSIREDKLSIQSENFIKLLLTISPDINSILVKLAEVLWNLRMADTKNAEQQASIASIVSKLYAPIAHRLGLYAIKTEMEDLSMKYLYPVEYKDIASKLEQTKHSREAYIKSFISPIKQELKKQNIICEIKGRPKAISSIWKKIKTQGVDFDEVYDKFAIRIIIDSIEQNEKNDCWRVYSIITDWYTPNPNRLRDWISTPKLSGYESLHTTVIGPEQKWVEVQIRTQRMDEIAEKGHAAHWKYKEKKEGSGSDWLSEIRRSLEQADEINKDEEHDKNKASLYTDEIFLFTPNGDLRKSKRGNTVLDFAFSIHSNIGETCTGAIINKKIVPIKQLLKNGDHIKILTSKNQKPRYEWLDIVKSSRAKAKIRKALKLHNYKDSELGKDIIKYKLSQLKIDFNDANINRLSKYFDYKSSIDLYQAVGVGKLEVNKIKKAFAEDEQVVEKSVYVPEDEMSKLIKKSTQSKDFLIIEDNLQTIDYQMAKCCNPIPGDNIFGFVTVTKGIKIHKLNCSNAKDLTERYPYRVIKAMWKQNIEFENFVAQLKITGYDNIGVTSEITHIIANEFKLNIRSINTNINKLSTFNANVVIGIGSKKQLHELIKRLQGLKDIIEVVRVSSS